MNSLREQLPKFGGPPVETADIRVRLPLVFDGTEGVFSRCFQPPLISTKTVYLRGIKGADT